MAFETYTTRQAGIHRGVLLLHQLRQIYTIAKSVQLILADYQAATDPAMNATVNALFTPAERAELSAMLAQINGLVTDWELNHPNAIG